MADISFPSYTTTNDNDIDINTDTYITMDDGMAMNVDPQHGGQMGGRGHTHGQ